MSRVEKAWLEMHPEIAAARAAEKFERTAIPIPSALQTSESAPKWKLRIHQDSAELYRSLVIAGDGGLTLKALRASFYMGRQRGDEAIRLLRRSGLVTETRSTEWPREVTLRLAENA